MLDTNIVSDLIRNPQGKVAKRIAKLGEDNICTSIIVAAELRYGCAKSGSKRLLKAVEDLLGEINVLPTASPSEPIGTDSEYRLREHVPRRAGSGGKADRRQRPADRRPCLCDRRHDRDRQYRRVHRPSRIARPERARELMQNVA